MKQPEMSLPSVSLFTAEDGSERVVLAWGNHTDATLSLTACQGRELATKLITAVNRAEVKASLKVSSNMWRSQERTRNPPINISMQSLKHA